MTVKCLSHEDKYEIAMLYVGKQMSSEELGKAYDVSKRTINRVLVEMGVNRVRHCQPRVKGEDIFIPETPAPKQLELQIDMIELTFFEKVQCMFKAIFWRTPNSSNVQSRN